MGPCAGAEPDSGAKIAKQTGMRKYWANEWVNDRETRAAARGGGQKLQRREGMRRGVYDGRMKKIRIADCES